MSADRLLGRKGGYDPTSSRGTLQRPCMALEAEQEIDETRCGRFHLHQTARARAVKEVIPFHQPVFMWTTLRVLINTFLAIYKSVVDYVVYALFVTSQRDMMTRRKKGSLQSSPVPLLPAVRAVIRGLCG